MLRREALTSLWPLRYAVLTLCICSAHSPDAASPAESSESSVRTPIGASHLETFGSADAAGAGAGTRGARGGLGFDGADLARVRETMGSVTSGDAVGEEEDAAEMGMAADLLRGVGEVLKSLRESARINELSLLSLTQKLRQKTSRTRGSIEQKNSSKPLARSGSDVLGKEHNQAKYHLKQVTSGLEGLTDIANSVEDAKDDASTKAQTAWDLETFRHSSAYIRIPLC